MWIYVWDTEIKWIYLWDTPVKEVYLWDTKIRPSVTPITTAWIYRNETDGLISLSSDGSTRYTMADKNLWATSTDVSSSASYWNYYQRWNNYWFTSSPQLINSQTNAANYWPSNYYSSNLFRYKWNYSWYNWDSSNNHNLRWWVTNTNASKKWPCNTWFHIPSREEWINLFNAFKAIWTDEWRWKWDYMKTYLKLPYAWLIMWSNWSYATENRYWTATSYTQSSNYYYNAYCISFSSYNISIDGTYPKIRWLPIRPFSDTAVQPDTSWTKLY